jgi:hypothetical protein
MSWLFSDDDDEGPRGTRWSLATGIIVGALALATLWMAVAITAGPERDDDGSGGARPGAQPTVRGTETAEPTAAPAEACAEVYEAQTPLLRAAAAALVGWQLHAEAMKRRVADDSTLARAQAYWARTRREADGLLDRYDEAAAAYAARTVRCPANPPRDDSTGRVENCRSAATARDTVLRRAGRAVATWREHMLDMEMLRQDTLSPSQARRQWRQSWRAGQAELRAYERAQRAAVGLSC